MYEHEHDLFRESFRAFVAREVLPYFDAWERDGIVPRETAVYHLLGTMQREAPRLYARISSIRSVGGGELLLLVADLPVRTMTSVTLTRLSDIEPVERDLARRQLRAAELDLRYRDQVIARLP